LFKPVCRVFVALVVLAVASFPAMAQDPNSQPPASNLPATINVYLDCSGGCDFDFFREEISYVDWVRDRAVSDVHILVTNQRTGAGGTEYILTFIGMRSFAQTVDTLKYVASPNATSDDVRRGLVRVIKTGLVHFLSRTALADRLNVSVTPLAANAAPQSGAAQRDPWHAWVFAISGNGFTNGEKSYKSLFTYYDIEASRVTVKWKTVFGGESSYDDNKYIVEGIAAGGGDSTFVNIQRNWNAYGTQFRALGEHWSTGVTGTIGSNSYNNQDRYMRAKYGVEYNIFPYKEATRRQLRAQYGIGVAHYNYTEETIYLKTSQTEPIHYAALLTSARQPWGSLNGTVTHNALLRDPSKRSTRINGNMNVRIFKGLSFNMGGSYSWIHDQLYLSKGELTTDDVLLRQRALKTSYSYFGNFGLRYQFGSIFNNVVFPRFGGNDVF
jgi:hypothetical protein